MTRSILDQMAPQTDSEGGLRAVGGFGSRTRGICFFAVLFPVFFVAGDRPFKRVGAITQSLATILGDFVVAWRHGRRALVTMRLSGAAAVLRGQLRCETAKPRFWQFPFAGAVAFPNRF
jgi:hypothetical protein